MPSSGPRDAFDLVQNGVYGINDLNNDMTRLINTHRVTRSSVQNLQNKLNHDQQEWLSLQSVFTMKSFLTREELMVFELVKGKIRSLNGFQQALNQLWGIV